MIKDKLVLRAHCEQLFVHHWTPTSHDASGHHYTVRFKVGSESVG